MPSSGGWELAPGTGLRADPPAPLRVIAHARAFAEQVCWRAPRSLLITRYRTHPLSPVAASSSGTALFSIFCNDPGRACEASVDVLCLCRHIAPILGRDRRTWRALPQVFMISPNAADVDALSRASVYAVRVRAAESHVDRSINGHSSFIPHKTSFGTSVLLGMCAPPRRFSVTKSRRMRVYGSLGAAGGCRTDAARSQFAISSRKLAPTLCSPH